jgi:hypothetical protein
MPILIIVSPCRLAVSHGLQGKISFMNIAILTYGSRGDIQPFLPLSLGLMARGHSVRRRLPLDSKISSKDMGFDLSLWLASLKI